MQRVWSIDGSFDLALLEVEVEEFLGEPRSASCRECGKAEWERVPAAFEGPGRHVSGESNLRFGAAVVTQLVEGLRRGERASGFARNLYDTANAGDVAERRTVGDVRK